MVSRLIDNYMKIHKLYVLLTIFLTATSCQKISNDNESLIIGKWYYTHVDDSPYDGKSNDSYIEFKKTESDEIYVKTIWEGDMQYNTGFIKISKDKITWKYSIGWDDFYIQEISGSRLQWYSTARGVEVFER